MMAASAGRPTPSTAAVTDRLRAAVTGQVEPQASLAGLTTLKIGGPALALVRAESVDDLVAIAAVCAELAVPWLVVGRGSNMLIADAGWPGVAITLGKGLRGVSVLPGQDPRDRRVRIGAAEPMPVLANTLQRQLLGGMAFAVAIPGTVGGAVRMNAGAHGGQMADVLVWAKVVSMGSGTTQRFDADRLDMRYRQTALPPDAIVTEAEVSLQHTDADTLAADMAEMRQWRRDHQPINEPSCGSVFRNPPGDSAGRLIDTAGLKGLAVGNARISTKHANFITVKPGATASDVHTIIRQVQRDVQNVHGLLLHPEVVIAGAFDHEETA